MRLPKARFTVISLMIAVAAFALLANALRPISQAEAVVAAKRRFQQIPGASAWRQAKVVSYVMDEGTGKSLWIVNFKDPANDHGIAQVSLNPSGKILAVTVHVPGSASPTPAEFLADPLPPPVTKQ